MNRSGGVPLWGRDGPRRGEEVRGASADGAAGGCKRDSTGAQSSGAGQAQAGAVKEFIDEILRADQQAPRKQRHTGHHIWARICRERPEVTVAESTVRHYVARRKQELGLVARETFVPQVYDWGSEAQVDWYEALAEVMGELRKVFRRCATTT